MHECGTYLYSPALVSISVDLSDVIVPSAPCKFILSLCLFEILSALVTFQAHQESFHLMLHQKIVLFMPRMRLLWLHPWFNVYDLWVVGIKIVLASRKACLILTISH